MANTITKNHSFGEVIDALKLKNVKACRECWEDMYKADDCYIWFNEEKHEVIKFIKSGECKTETEFIVIDAEDLFAEDWMIIYHN